MNKDMTLYELIEYKVDRQSLTFVQFSKKANISTPTLYATKYRKPSLNTYHKLANAFKMDVWELRQYPISK